MPKKELNELQKAKEMKMTEEDIEIKVGIHQDFLRLNKPFNH